MKKCISFLLSVVMLLSITAGLNLSAYADTEGEWEYTRFSSNDDVYITGYKGSQTDIDIPSTLGGKTVAALSGDVFKNNITLKSITLPETLYIIGSGAFDGCTSLTDITILNPHAVLEEYENLIPKTTVIHGYADSTAQDYAEKFQRTFAEISAPESPAEVWEYTRFSSNDDVYIIGYNGKEDTIEVPSTLGGKTVAALSGNVFKNNKTLKSITLPETLYIIGGGAFDGCTSLTDITILNYNAVLGDDEKAIPETTVIHGYSGSSVQAYAEKFHRTFVAIDQSSDFQYSVIGDGKVEITGYTGSDDTVEIPSTLAGNTVTSIKAYAFSMNRFTHVSIPESVEKIGSGAFDGCFNLESITVAEGNKNYSSQNGILFDKNKTILIQYPMDLITPRTDPSATAYTIPSTVTKIEAYAFYGSKWLSKVTIPESVETIGAYAFSNCMELQGFVIAPENQHYAASLGALYNKDKTQLIQYPLGNTSKTYDVYDGALSIASGAFAGQYNGKTYLEEVSIPASVNIIGNQAFLYCKSLKKVEILNPECKIDDDNNTIPKNVTIYGYRNSTAKAYADKHGNPFVAEVGITVLATDLGVMALNGVVISSYGKQTQTKNLEYGASYTLTAYPNEDTEFVGWYSNGKLITRETTYTTYAYADEVYQPVFEERNNDTFHVTFVDMYGNVIAILDNEAIQSLEEMPACPEYAGMKFTGWSRTLEEVKQMKDSDVVYAYYASDEESEFTVTATGCTITVDGQDFRDSATAHYNSLVTVKAQDGEFKSWTVNGTVAAYSNAYSFRCGSDVVVTNEDAGEEAKPLVASVSKTESAEDYRVKFLATRFVPEDYSLVESGFVYGKGMEQEDLTLDNVGTVQGTADGTVKSLKNSNTSAEGQFALTYGVKSKDAAACARPYMIYKDSDGAATLVYGNMLTSNYPD